MRYFLVSFIILFLTTGYSQVDNVPADHPVYPFLKKLFVQGVIDEYNDVVLPLSRKKVVEFLHQAEENNDRLNNTDRNFLRRMIEKLRTGYIYSEKSTGIFNKFPSGFLNNLVEDSQKHIYNYNDSALAFYIDPLAEYKFIHSDFYDDNSSLIYYGGTFRGSYDNWLGFRLQGTLGIQYGSRDVARMDQRVAQSFTFNDTKLFYFDATEGYLRLEKGIASLQLGRERILWGNGYIDKILLSDNPPKFDFIRFDISYKSLSYNFIHGWLVHPADTVLAEFSGKRIRTKPSKYIAISRFGFNPASWLNLGVSQVIIYSHRPFEAAYLNPFVFWESAQRSLNDLDNSFLSFEARSKLLNGFELSGSFTFDDINLENWGKGQFELAQNRWAWQIGAMITEPLLPENLSLRTEYLQLRPYIFSHYGLSRSALTYTNNDHFLGVNMHPNSTRFSADLNYKISSRLNFNFLYQLSQHGSNIYDQEGNLVKNVGGDIFTDFTGSTNEKAPLLDGILETTNLFSIGLNYEITYGIYIDLLYRHERYKIENLENNSNLFWSSIRVIFE